MEVIDVTTQNQLTIILKEVKNEKHRLIILLMYDAGLRVSEVLNITWANIHFRQKFIEVESLKKRGETVKRKIPISNRLSTAFTDFYSTKDIKPPISSYVFTNAQGKKMYRTSVNNMLKRLQHENPSLGNLHPHKLRHSFATNLRAHGAELVDIKDLLGHNKIDTSLIYAHHSTEKLKALIEASEPKQSFWDRIFNKIKRTKTINLILPDKIPLIGRDNELKRINDLLNKKISILITGKAGTGKKYMLNNLNFTQKTLIVDDCKEFKKSLINILLHLLESKSAVAELLYNTSDHSKLIVRIQKESIAAISKAIIDSTQKHEFILVISDIDLITDSSMKALKVLKEHFIILTTARNIKIKQSDFLWDFEKIELKNLHRKDALNLTYTLTNMLDIEDKQFMLNKIFDTSDGNPRMITELVERISKESIISNEIIEELCNSYLGRQAQEFDMSMILLLIFGGLAALKYVGRESGDSSLQFLGGIIMIILLFARYFFNYSKRKFI